jgi:hypothetical protein
MASDKQYLHQAALMAVIIERSGLQQNELAAHAGIHPQFISNVKRGLSPFPASWVNKLGKYATKTEFETAAINDFRVWWRARAKKS